MELVHENQWPQRDMRNNSDYYDCVRGISKVLIERGDRETHWQQPRSGSSADT